MHRNAHLQTSFSDEKAIAEILPYMHDVDRLIAEPEAFEAVPERIHLDRGGRRARFPMQNFGMETLDQLRPVLEICVRAMCGGQGFRL
jgi:hypothetical protein